MDLCQVIVSFVMMRFSIAKERMLRTRMYVKGQLALQQTRLKVVYDRSGSVRHSIRANLQLFNY